MKVIVGKDTMSEMEYNQRVSRKTDLFNSLIDLLEKYVQIEDREQLDKEGFTYFESQFYKRYSAEFPPLLSVEKMLELSEVDTKLIKVLFRQYAQIKIEGWNVKTVSAPTIDFNVYATNTEQIKRYELAKALCDAVNTIKSEYQRTMFLGSLTRATSGIVEVSFHDAGFLIPSVDFILNEN